MSKLSKKNTGRPGLVPGTLVYTGAFRDEEVSINVLEYDQDNFTEKRLSKPEECSRYKDTPGVSWITVNGLHDEGVIERIGKDFGIHPLVREDIVDTSRRPKVEEFRDHIFISVKVFSNESRNERISSEQVSFFLGENYVISFQEKTGDIFEPVRERARKAKGKLRERGSDYLVYALLDVVVDNYFLVLEKVGDDMEALEADLIDDPSSETLFALQGIKRDMIFLKKSVWPLREVIGKLAKGENSFLSESTMPYFRDVYDHTIQAIDTVETLRDMASGMFEIYLSSVNNRMNEVMKVLTIIATIFIPLTFIAGVYGMNFDPEVSRYNMPELSWRFGYFFSFGLMITVVLIMLVYFKRKKWM